MTREELIKDYESQIRLCEATIQQNYGVIQYCKARIDALNKPEEPKQENASSSPA